MKPIEVRVPADITKYEGSLWKGLTKRQVFSSIMIIVIFLGVFLLSVFVFPIPYILRMILTMILAVPVGIAGFLPYKGMYAEQFIPIMIRNLRMPKDFCKHDIPPKYVLDLIDESNNESKYQKENEDA